MNRLASPVLDLWVSNISDLCVIKESKLLDFASWLSHKPGRASTRFVVPIVLASFSACATFGSLRTCHCFDSSPHFRLPLSLEKKNTACSFLVHHYLTPPCFFDHSRFTITIPTLYLGVTLKQCQCSVVPISNVPLTSYIRPSSNIHYPSSDIQAN